MSPFLFRADNASLTCDSQSEVRIITDQSECNLGCDGKEDGLGDQIHEAGEHPLFELKLFEMVEPFLELAGHQKLAEQAQADIVSDTPGVNSVNSFLSTLSSYSHLTISLSNILRALR